MQHVFTISHLPHSLVGFCSDADVLTCVAFYHTFCVDADMRFLISHLLCRCWHALPSTVPSSFMCRLRLGCRLGFWLRLGGMVNTADLLPCLSSSKHHAVCMVGGYLDLIKLYFGFGSEAGQPQIMSSLPFFFQQWRKIWI